MATIQERSNVIKKEILQTVNMEKLFTVDIETHVKEVDDMI